MERLTERSMKPLTEQLRESLNRCYIILRDLLYIWGADQEKMMTQKRALLALLTFTAALCFTASASAAPTTVCVYDPTGANGDIFQMMKD